MDMIRGITSGLGLVFSPIKTSAPKATPEAISDRILQRLEMFVMTKYNFAGGLLIM